MSLEKEKTVSARNLDVMGQISKVSLCFHSSSMDANKDNYGISPTR